LLQRDRMPRDLLLRGRFREATGELSNINDELKRQLQIKEVPGLDAQIEQWVADANAQFRALQQAVLNGGGKPNAAKANQNAAQALASQGRPDLGLAQVIQAAAAEPMSAQVTYFVALCKQEEAERAQARQSKQLWESAASWWTTFLDNHGSNPGAGSARLLLARTRQAVGRSDEAVAILQEQASKATGLEKVACLYLARQWKAR
jgi:tetratricopeptide (TPR) repeat protein